MLPAKMKGAVMPEMFAKAAIPAVATAVADEPLTVEVLRASRGATAALVQAMQMTPKYLAPRLFLTVASRMKPRATMTKGAKMCSGRRWRRSLSHEFPTMTKKAKTLGGIVSACPTGPLKPSPAMMVGAKSEEEGKSVMYRHEVSEGNQSRAYSHMHACYTRMCGRLARCGSG